MRHAVSLALLASVVLGTGCNSPGGPTPTGFSSGSAGGGSSNSQGTMSTTIANVPWTANGRVTATYSQAQNGVGASVLLLTGQDSPLSQTLTISVGSANLGTALTLGTFQVGPTATNATLTDSFGTTYQAAGVVGNGNVTITAFSTATRTAAGTFNFVVVQTGGSATRAITNGSFNVTF